MDMYCKLHYMAITWKYVQNMYRNMYRKEEKRGKEWKNGKEWDREIEVSKGDRVDEKDIEKKMGRYERKENEKEDWKEERRK